MKKNNRAFVRNKSYEIEGEIDDFSQLQIVQNFNDVGKWHLECNARSEAAQFLSLEGASGIVFQRAEDPFTTLLSGPIFSFKETSDGTRRQLSIDGYSDECWLMARLAYQADNFSSSAYDTRTGTASTIMRQFVDVNMVSATYGGSGRVIPGLSLGTDPVVGSSVKNQGRLQSVLELLQEIARQGGDLGFRIIQDGTGITFDVYDPEDLTSEVVFAFGAGTLLSYDYTIERPTGNYVVVGGQGEGTARTFVKDAQDESVAFYGRWEMFFDRRDTNDATQLANALKDKLTENAEKVSVTVKPRQTEKQSYYNQYKLGDKVTAIVGDNVSVSDIIRQVTITESADQPEQIEPVIGSPDATHPATDREAKELRKLLARTVRLETV